jgi:hypothetical protein
MTLTRPQLFGLGVYVGAVAIAALHACSEIWW